MLGRLITCLYECKTVRMFWKLYNVILGDHSREYDEVGGWQADVSQDFYFRN